MADTMPRNTVQGSCDTRFERVREAFERNFAERGESGASVCVIVDGEPVVDLWGGVADEATGRPWEQDTMNVIMSCSKGLTALCGNMLIDQGRLDPDKPVAYYWPEFAQHGKGSIPVRMVFNHQSGVAHVDRIVPPDGAFDFDGHAAMLAATKPFWEPGTKAGYHGLSIGFLVGELVRRVDGRTIGRFLREEVAEPLGADAWIGLPASEDHRVATTIPFDLGIPDPPPWMPATFANPAGKGFQAFARMAMRSPRMKARLKAQMRGYLEAAGAPEHLADGLAQLDSLLARVFGNMGTWFPDRIDSREAHGAEIPAAGAISNGRGLATVYAPLSVGGTIDGVRLVSPGAIHTMATAQSVTDVDAVIGARSSYTMGFSKSWPNPELPDSSVIIGEDAFGTPGMGGQMGFADPSYRLAFGYTMTKHGIGTALNARAQSMIDACYEILGSPGRGHHWRRPS